MTDEEARQLVDGVMDGVRMQFREYGGREGCLIPTAFVINRSGQTASIPNVVGDMSVFWAAVKDVVVGNRCPLVVSAAEYEAAVVRDPTGERKSTMMGMEAMRKITESPESVVVCSAKSRSGWGFTAYAKIGNPQADGDRTLGDWEIIEGHEPECKVGGPISDVMVWPEDN